ncbi:ATPase family AAA domain-containing protein 2 [Orussus abietinus]|uniref:ATPase family AAA domain-containing protein 2 n=1 Tax=Orussus abietinus TaxID=222816 RepID=UPI000625393E|nr:ATPase family AAA domain-containing protein 2 [Orussus abietinus]
MAAVKDFSCVGGLEKQVKIVKDMVLFPLMYGDVYAKFNLRPPRGLLFYGPPGTGKTLVASALAGECSNSERKVSFIARKGSDCLSKWVGESEKKLQKVFTRAQQTKPCIIFFDEVDGLAPIRSNRQDFVHASVVSTLLALMDGLDNNSEVIVIGATNRLDAIDPALRRPGRFDRELYFPLPCYAARKDILSIHVKSWKQKPPQKFLAYLASKTVGYCGSDLQALCVEAVMCCVRRNYPQIYSSKSKHHINERSLKVEKQDFLKARQNIVPASHRVTIAPVKCLSNKMQPMLQESLAIIVSRLEMLCPTGMLTSDNITGSACSRSSGCPRILLCGLDDCHTRHLGPALLHTLEHLPCHILDVTTLFEETGRAAEEAIIQKVKAARHTLPSLLYVPDLLAWWDLVDEAARVVFASLLRGLDRTVHMLVLTTANCSLAGLPEEISSLFDEYQGEVYEVRPPGLPERQAFFKQIFLRANSSSDDVSNRSSYADVSQVVSPKKMKVESNARKLKCNNSQTVESTVQLESPEAVEVLAMRKVKTEGRGRTKISSVLSCHSTTSKSRLNIKREHSASGEGVATKRQKLMNGCSTLKPTGSSEKLNEEQLHMLLQKAVQLTEGCICQQLESLCVLLELTLEKCEDDVYGSLVECLTRFEELENSRYRVKKEMIL